MRVFRYEDLWTADGEQVRRLIEFCGLDPDRYPFDEARDLPVLNSSESVSKSGRLTWQPVDRSNTFDPRDRWTDWTTEDHSRFNWLAGAAAKRYGYALHDAPEMVWRNRLLDARWSTRRAGASVKRWFSR